MMGKKTGLRGVLACAIAAALTLGGVATTLAMPTVAEAYPYTATKPIHLKSELSYGASDVIQLSGGKDYWFAGKVDIDHYEVEGGTAEKPTRLYFTSSSSLGGPLTVDRGLRYSQRPLFVLKGGYVEFIGDSGSSTEVYCNGKTFLSDNGDYGTSKGGDKPNTGESLNLSVKDLKLISKIDVNYESDRAITLYGTMGRGETATFTNVNVSNWDCAKNAAGSFSNIASDYVASAAPVTIRGCHVALDATFTNCTFDGNCDDCVGALSVVGRAKRPKATLNNCSFKNNYQTMISCDSLKVESDHVHSGNIGVKNADVVLNGCSIASEPYAAPSYRRCPSAYMEYGYDMHMTSAVAVAKDASCTISDTTIDDSYARFSTDKYGKPYSIQDAKRSTVYALGSVTIAGKTKITSTVAKGLDASGVGSYGKIHVDESFTGSAFLSVDEDKFDSEANPKNYYYEYVNLGTTDLSREDLASRLKLANDNLTYEVTDGKVKVTHRRHEHAWSYSVDKNGYSIAAKCTGQYEASHCSYSRDGDTISLMSSKDGDLSFTYNGKVRDAVLDTTKPSQKDDAVAQGKVKITAARFYQRADESDTKGFEMEGSQPLNAGCYRVVATVSIEGQEDVTLERLFSITSASLVEKDSNRNALCKIEVIGYDKLRDGVKFRSDTLNDVPSYKWTGEEITPRIKVTYKLGDEWIELREGVDFERLEWGESVSEKDPGTYRSQIWGLGNYVYGPFYYWTIYGTQFENVRAEGFDGAYDGKAHAPSVTVDNAPGDIKVEFSSDGGSTWSTSKPAYKDVTRDDVGAVSAKTVKYRITASDYVPVEGEVAIKIAPADQEAPKDVKATAATGHGLSDGFIDGVDGACEWKAVSSEAEYQAVAKGETSIEGLAAGTYNVRLRADDNHNASKAVTVEVADGPKKVDGTGWKFDDAEHWNNCTCGKEKIDEATHAFEWVIDKEPTATEPGSKHEECTVCGYATASIEIPAASVGGYSGEYDGNWHSVDTTSLPDGVTPEYSADGGKTWTSEAPKIKDVGIVKAAYRATVDGIEVTGEVELTVTPRKITVAAADAFKVYGEADPALGYTVTEGSLVEGEGLDGITVAREKGDTVKDGSYAITVSQKKGANANYAITFAPGVFTVTKRALTVTWGSTDFTYDGKSHVPAVALGNALKGDEVSATVEGAQAEVNRAGETYTATIAGLKGAASGNYALPAEGLSCSFTIKNAPQDAPKVQAEAESISGKHDGKITGVDATMEWRAKDAAVYQAVSGDAKDLADLAPGTYYVRYRAKANHDASPDTEVTVIAGRKLMVALPTEQTGYVLTATATELDWHGSATLKLDIDDAYFAGKGYAVKVNGEKIELDASGSYELKNVESDINVTVEGVLKHEPDGTGWKSDDASHWHICRCGDVIDKASHDFEWVCDTPATVEAEGVRHQVCKVCGARGKDGEIDILAPAIVEGADQTLTKVPEVPVDSDLTVRSNAPLRLFKKVLVDGVEVASDNYTLKEGSTIVTLKAAYLATLPVGEHRLSVVSESGTAETTFTIAEQQKPADGGDVATGGNGSAAKPSASKVNAKKGTAGKSAKATMPVVGDSTMLAVVAALTAGIAAIAAALVVRRR